MPRLNQAVPKYRKHKSTGQAIVTINGRDHYLGPHRTKASYREYDRLIGEWLATGRSPTFGATAAEITIVELVVSYLTHAQAYYGAGQRGEYANMRRVLRPLKELYGRSLAREFGPLQLKAVRETFIAAGHARKHINQNVQRIGRVFRWGVSEGLIPPDVPQALAMVPGLRRGHTSARETEKVRPADDRLVDATLPYLPPVVRDMVEFQRLTGCRPAEVCLLRPGDVDRSSDVWTYAPLEHKNANRGHDRTVYIGPRAQDVLRAYLLRSADAYCFSRATQKPSG